MQKQNKPDLLGHFPSSRFVGPFGGVRFARRLAASLLRFGSPRFKMVQCFTFGNLFSLHIVWLNRALLAIIRKPFIARKHKASVNPWKKLCMKLQSWVGVGIFGATTTRQLSTCKQKVPGHTTKNVSPLNRHRSILLRASPRCWEVCNKSFSRVSSFQGTFSLVQASNWFNKVSKGWMM